MNTLVRYQVNYIQPETLHDASDLFNNALASLSIFRHYHIQEDQFHASADGQKFETTWKPLKLGTPQSTSAPIKGSRP